MCVCVEVCVSECVCILCMHSGKMDSGSNRKYAFMGMGEAHIQSAWGTMQCQGWNLALSLAKACDLGCEG